MNKNIKICTVFMNTQSMTSKTANLVDVVEFEVSEEEEQQRRDGFNNDLFMSVDVNTEPH